MATLESRGEVIGRVLRRYSKGKPHKNRGSKGKVRKDKGLFSELF